MGIVENEGRKIGAVSCLNSGVTKRNKKKRILWLCVYVAIGILGVSAGQFRLADIPFGGYHD